MRGLKAVAILSVLVLLSAIGFVGYLFLTAQVSVIEITSHGVSCSSDPERFESIRKSVDEDTFEGTLFQKVGEWKEADEYVYLTYTIDLNNNCLVPIDMVEAQVVPQPTDILQIGDRTVRSLSPRSDGRFSVTILAPKDTHSVREIIVTYYMWGVSGSVKKLCGE